MKNSWSCRGWQFNFTIRCVNIVGHWLLLLLLRDSSINHAFLKLRWRPAGVGSLSAHVSWALSTVAMERSNCATFAPDNPAVWLEATEFSALCTTMNGNFFPLLLSPSVTVQEAGKKAAQSRICEHIQVVMFPVLPSASLFIEEKPSPAEPKCFKGYYSLSAVSIATKTSSRLP